MSSGMIAVPQVTHVAEPLTDGLKSMPCAVMMCSERSVDRRVVCSQNEQVCDVGAHRGLIGDSGQVAR
jgi:hypothetical protein